MQTRTRRILAVVAGAGWLVVGGYGLRSMLVGPSDDWAVPYTTFTLGLLVATVLTVTMAAAAQRGERRRLLQIATLVPCVLGAAATALVAWALPLWMTLIGVGLVLMAVASATDRRRG